MLSLVAGKLARGMIPAPIRKAVPYVIGVVIVIGGFWWWLRIHDNKVYDEAKRATELEMLEKHRVEKEALINDAEKKADAMRQKLMTEIQEIEAEFNQLKNREIVMRRTYESRLKAAATERETRDAQIPSIPASELDAAIRVRLQELRSGDNATDSSPHR